MWTLLLNSNPTSNSSSGIDPAILILYNFDFQMKQELCSPQDPVIYSGFQTLRFISYPAESLTDFLALWSSIVFGIELSRHQMFDIFGSGSESEPTGNDHLKQMRERMVEEQIAGRGITDPRVLEAMRSIPRHEFVKEQTTEAYEDRPLPIGNGQTISQPYMVAWMTDVLDLETDHTVLEIGTGSGYQTAILAHIADRVYTVERHDSLTEEARKTLDRLEIQNVEYRVGDGTLGWPEHAPYDRIMVTAGAPSVPGPLKNQLSKQNGKLVIPVGESSGQVLTRVLRDGESFEREKLGNCVFVQLIGEEGW